MLKHGGGLRDEDGAEAEVHGSGSERIHGELRKGDERCFISLEEEEETMMEEEADKERTSVGMGGGS